ncbi:MULTISPECIES: penicillin-binding protein 1A [Acetobacter]|uniref:Penicillin-binding protein 1A n=1 Tax=Acetobacter lovaniensis TaxID=104100 RepID=A0A841QH78_9PROT|nr:PBP1A family penicillin-binding protein [Acetobacter lovaniensis]MBB6457695.1 penicillin-binding protein 1A [Acetobacter lovaniensis]MCI1698948.1 PBP1A family penicillin-binding protein [Acetobacter lovaniensis]MCP1240937.1 PBP1A family penicillin-binding protein [Acetobacter lovaniensis]NHN82961.1 PBP1A family penicillin-binding protein [Acetobacter lovaniensis]
MTRTPPSGDPDSSPPHDRGTAQSFVLSRPRFRQWRMLLGTAAAVLLVGSAGGAVVVWSQYQSIVSDLPTVDGLRSYQPPVMSRLYASDDQLVAELADERRVFVPSNAIPDRVKSAFIAAEDQKFWTHKGVDPAAIIRAGLTDLTRGRGRRPIGASTITQQVARVMLLGSNAVSFKRKAKEAFLAMRIEQVLPKEKILEIYLNEIYLGNGAYGIGAAAQTYFNKPLDQLDNAEVAFLAALPKSPTNYNPARFPDAARGRRNWVLERMADIGAITQAEARMAEAEPLVSISYSRPGPAPGSEWFAEEVRRELLEKYGQDVTMQGGLDVHTSLDLPLQRAAQTILQQGLMAYDRQHRGWHGPVTHLNTPVPLTQDEWVRALRTVSAPPGMLDQWRLAIVLDGNKGQVGWLEGSVVRRNVAQGGEAHTGQIQSKDMAWVRRARPLRTGDIVMVEPQSGQSGVALMQIPVVEGAIVTMNARTGRVLALVGGWSFQASQFDRATQALRQPGSSFKPFVYLQAMEQGISPSQEFDDSPVSYGTWHPNNYEKDFWGPTSLHDALRESRNLVTIRLAAHLGMNTVADTAIKLGLVDSMPHVLPAALGAVETTVLKEAGAYAALAAGGRRITPTLIDDVQDRDGHVIWRPASGLSLVAASSLPAEGGSPANGVDAIHPDAPQTNAGGAGSGLPSPQPSVVVLTPQDLPALRDDRPVVASEQSAFQITTMLQDVIRRGTGVRAGEGIDTPIAGKTGTSQNFNDAWFAGYTPELVTVVWIGFDTPQSLGRNETGGAIAGPLWNKVMKTALKDQPKLDFAAPDGVTLVSYDTGRGVAIDAFKDGQLPGVSANLLSNVDAQQLSAADTGAENMPDSESDMAASINGTGQSGAAAASPAEGNSAPPPAPSGGDIGMGGLY